MIRVGQGFDVHQLVEGKTVYYRGSPFLMRKGCWDTPTQTYCCMR